MKQFILSYKDFLVQEALTPEESQKYKSINVVENVKKIHNKIFGDQERIYIPFDFSVFERSEKSEIQEEIEELLTSKGYEIVSYSQNQCKKQNDSRITKIGKVLVSRDINRQDLSIAFMKDVEKTRGVLDTSDMSVVFSRNSDDIASMSTDRPWTSCQNIRVGSLRSYVAEDIKQGSIIAYLIKSTDKEILDPEARILIKPFINIENESDVVLLPSTVSYYRNKGFEKGENAVEKYPKFSEFVMSWVKLVQPNINGRYKMNSEVYHDGETDIEMFKKLSKKEIERALNPKNIEDLKLSFDYYQIPVDVSKIDTYDDGLYGYNGEVRLKSKDFSETPKFFENFKYFKSLYFFKCKNLTDITSLKNITKMDELIFNSCSLLKNLTPLENLTSVRGLSLENCQSLQTLNGLENLKDILSLSFEFCENLEDIKALKNIKSVKSLNFGGCRNLSNLDGLQNLETVLWGIDFNECVNLKDLSPLKNLKKVMKLKFERCYNLEKFSGLENLKEVEEVSFKSCKNLKTIESISNIKKATQFSFIDCEDLVDLTPLKNLEYVDILDFSGCENLKSLNGLENLKEISELNLYRCVRLQNLKGLSKELEYISIYPKQTWQEKYMDYKNS